MRADMAEPTDTHDLVERARRGDRAAFDALAAIAREQLLVRIGHQVGRKLREKVDLEDVLQEVLLRAFQAVGAFQGEDAASFSRWLEGIARNVIRNLVRRRGWKKELEITRDLPGPAVSPSRSHRRQERFERLSASVEGLSPDYQTVIRLARIEGRKIAAIAALMDRSPSAVKNLLLRAMRELKSSFGDTESLTLPQTPPGDEESADEG